MTEPFHGAPFIPNHDTQLIIKSKLSGFSVSVQKVSSSHADTTVVFLKVPSSGLHCFLFLSNHLVKVSASPIFLSIFMQMILKCICPLIHQSCNQQSCKFLDVNLPLRIKQATSASSFQAKLCNFHAIFQVHPFFGGPTYFYFFHMVH